MESSSHFLVSGYMIQARKYVICKIEAWNDFARIIYFTIMLSFYKALKTCMYLCLVHFVRVLSLPLMFVEYLVENMIFIWILDEDDKNKTTNFITNSQHTNRLKEYQSEFMVWTIIKKIQNDYNIKLMNCNK